MKKIPLTRTICAAVLSLTVLMSGSAEGQTYVYGWDNNLKKDCYSTYVLTTPVTLSPSMGTDAYAANNSWSPRYRLGATCENYYYTGGTLADVPYSSPVWLHNWSKDTNGFVAVLWGVDKYNYNSYRDKHTAFTWSEAWDVGTGPRILTESYVNFRMLLAETPLGSYSAADNGFGQPIGWSKLRVSAGFVAIWNNRNHYLEVNLWRTDNYDDVTTTSNFDPSPPGWPWLDDANGVYDKRAYFTPTDLVYYKGTKLHQIPGMLSGDSQPELTGSLQSYSIPAARLFRHTVWSDYPASWDDIRISGFYIAVEVWGGGKCAVAFDRYRFNGW